MMETKFLITKNKTEEQNNPVAIETADKKGPSNSRIKTFYNTIFVAEQKLVLSRS